MAVEEVRRLLQSRAGADGAVHERRLPREKKIVVLLRDSHIFQEHWHGRFPWQCVAPRERQSYGFSL